MQKTLAIIAHNSKSALEEILKRDGFDVLRIPHSPLLAPPVRAHADMLVFPIGDTVFCHESYAKDNANILFRFAELGYKIRPICSEYGADYPNDVLFNAVLIGKRIFLGSRTSADDICEYACERGFEVVRVNQGYTKCSTCVVGENAIITADTTIEKAAREREIDVLKISEGFVDLFGYSHGFIGGASGSFCDTVYFVGDPHFHPDGEKIFEFCQAHGKKISYIEGEKLSDIGSIIFLPPATF